MRVGGRRGEPLFSSVQSLAWKGRGQRFQRGTGFREGVYKDERSGGLFIDPGVGVLREDPGHRWKTKDLFTNCFHLL